jgi:membrane-associated protease RseP (regulator of RpoE activity)
MAFYIYDLTFLVLFSLGVVIFLWKRRKNLQREGIMYLYRTKVGVKFIDYVGEKYKKTIKVYGFLGVVCGYILMALMLYFLYYILKIYLFNPDVVRAIKIPPLMPLIPYLPSLFKVNFLPPFYFTYWILAIAIIAIFHEFAHGIVAKRYGVKIKTTGFGFLGPFLAAFVEPDEKQMQKKSKFQQISILSAGVFTNLILSILFFFLLAGFFALTYQPAGAIFNAYASGIVNTNTISVIGGVGINNASNKALLNIIDKNNLTDDLFLGTNGNTLNLTKIYAGNKTYFMNIETLKYQLEQNQSFVILYEDLPAIKNALGKISDNRLSGIIVEINGNKIKDHEDVSNVLKNLNPGDKIKLITKDEGGYLEYEFELGEDPSEQGKVMIGLGYASAQKESILGRIFNFFNFFREPSTYYEPRFNAELVLFIYNLIWWIALINLSVALVNMWPVAIFDGGRMFMLTIWGITGSEKFAQIIFKVITYIILASLLVLMFGWFIAIF